MKPISVGDLVMVVKPSICCGHIGDIGKIFTVAEICKADCACDNCGEESPSVICCEKYDEVGFDIERLKRIHPLSELESIKSSEEITA